MRHESEHWWSFAVSVGASVLSALLAAGLAWTVSERSRNASRDAVCEIARTQLAVYRAEPPSTPTGEQAREAWRNAYYHEWKCEADDSPR